MATFILCLFCLEESSYERNLGGESAITQIELSSDRGVFPDQEEREQDDRFHSSPKKTQDNNDVQVIEVSKGCAYYRSLKGNVRWVLVMTLMHHDAAWLVVVSL